MLSEFSVKLKLLLTYIILFRQMNDLAKLKKSFPFECICKRISIMLFLEY